MLKFTRYKYLYIPYVAPIWFVFTSLLIRKLKEDIKRGNKGSKSITELLKEPKYNVPKWQLIPFSVSVRTGACNVMYYRVAIKTANSKNNSFHVLSALACTPRTKNNRTVSKSALFNWILESKRAAL